MLDTMQGSPEPTADGRRARRERGRAAVLDAVIDHLRDGNHTLGAGEIASRAGVSEATLFRYFDTLADLQHEATTRYFGRFASLFEIPRIGAGPLDARARRFAAARVELYQAIAPIARAGRARAVHQQPLADALLDARLRQAEQVRAHFCVELGPRSRSAGDDLVALVSTLTSFESWDQQHSALERTPMQIRRSWRNAIVVLFT